MPLQRATDYALSLEGTAAGATPGAGSEPPSTPLTTREREVARLVAQGLTNRRISEELSISERTVTTHVGRILKKLGLASRTQIAAWIAEQANPASDST
jgi:DNA-binding NarL/FixJ family response regulator